MRCEPLRRNLNFWNFCCIRSSSDWATVAALSSGRTSSLRTSSSTSYLKKRFCVIVSSYVGPLDGPELRHQLVNGEKANRKPK